ncbi:MAG: helix-turn-helix domain-containing protein [Candidatus Hodarchaeota archaeon]
MKQISENKIKLEDFLVNKQITSIFLLLKTSDRPLGVREIQRNLNMSSAGSTHWHLQKLLENGAIRQVEGNKYQLVDKYDKLRSIPLRVVLNHYFVGNKLVPNVFFLMFFLVNVLILAILAVILDLWILGFFLGFSSTIVSLFIIFRFYHQILRDKE